MLVVVSCAVLATFLILQKHAALKVPAPSLPVEKVTIGNIGEYSIFNIIAKENGYFRDNALDATVDEYESGPPAMAALLSGEADIIVSADFVGVRNIFTHPEIRILAQASKHRVFQVVARKDKGIESPADLRGKKIGVTKKSVGEFFLGRFLAFNNLYVADVKAIDLVPAAMIEQLTQGTIDAALIFEPHAYGLEQKLGDMVHVWSAQGEQNVFALIYSTDAFVQMHPEVIERYLRSLESAEIYTKQYPAEAKELAVRALHYDHAYVDYSWSKFSHTLGLNQELLITMEDEARWVIDNGLTEEQKVPNYLENIYFDGLERVKPESVTIIH